jgi:ABC-type transport system involved in multi-copper enzyme maturation permease subunit
MGAGVSLALLYVGGRGETLALTIWPAIVLIFIELMIITSVALLFSSFSSPALSALLTFLVFTIGHFSSDLKTFAGSMESAVARWLFVGLYYLLPNLSNYSYITPAAHGQAPTFANVLLALAYAAVYIIIIMAAATLVLSKRNFK